jgi:hypothetical protein
MLNGDSLRGHHRATNTAYVVPVPGSETQYYLFTVGNSDYQALTGSAIYYSLIDMQLNNGLGDVIADAKNIFLEANVTEKIAATPKSDGDGYWLLTHDYNSNHFHVRSITEQGISEPATYAVGAAHKTTLWNHDSLLVTGGHMRISPNGRKLAVALLHSDFQPFQLFDFDPETGQVSNPADLGDYAASYGVSFSTDSEKLYLHGYGIVSNDEGAYDFDYLWQFDLNAEDIFSSRVGLINRNPSLNQVNFGPRLANFAMQLGPDGRLYAAVAPDEIEGRALLVINYPNKAGWACNVEIKTFDFGNGRRSVIDLPNFIQSIFDGLVPDDSPDDNRPCEGTSFAVFPNPVEDKLHITVSGGCASNYKFRIYDTLGKTLGQFDFLGNEHELDVSTLAAGLYLIEIMSGNDSSYNSSILKVVKI